MKKECNNEKKYWPYCHYFNSVHTNQSCRFHSQTMNLLNYYHQVQFHSFVIKRSLRIIKAISPLFTNMEWVWRCPSSWGSLRSASYQHLVYRCTTRIAPCGSKIRNKHIDWTRCHWSRWFLPPQLLLRMLEKIKDRGGGGEVLGTPAAIFANVTVQLQGKKKEENWCRSRLWVSAEICLQGSAFQHLLVRGSYFYIQRLAWDEMKLSECGKRIVP